MKFFDDLDLGTKRRKSVLKVLPPFPHTGWTPPTYFPDLSSAVALSFDVETKETDWDHGPGWARKKGHIVGIGIGAIDALGNRGQWYFPMRHEVQREYNLDPAWVVGHVRPVLENPYVPKVGANLIYDVGWMTEEDIFVQGELHDVQFAEALLDEDAFVALDVLGTKYMGVGKTTNVMYDWINQAYSPHKREERGEIYRTPPSLVGHYVEGDVSLPLDVSLRQIPILDREGLYDVYRMECDLIPLLVQMRRAGVNIDLQKAETLYYDLGKELEVLYAKLSLEVGKQITRVSSGDELAVIFDHFGIKYPRTKETNKPSFRKEWLAALEHPIGAQINAIRMIEKIRDTFIKSYILEANINGKIHGSFHPLRGEEGGTKTGRFSCVAGFTLIETNRGLKRIDQLKIGEKVLTHKKRYRKVTAKWLKGIEPMLNVTFSNGDVLTCTISHKLLSSTNQWITIEEVANEYFKKMGFTVREYIKHFESLSQQRNVNSFSNSKNIKNNFPQCSAHYKNSHASCRTSSFKKIQVSRIQNGRKKSDVQKNTRSASFMERCNRRRVWVSNSHSQRRTSISSSNRYGSCFMDQKTPRYFRGTSYRWQSKKQSFRQFSPRDPRRSQTYTFFASKGQQLVSVDSIHFAGCHKVYDITVEEDHSYATCGTFSHNSSDPNLQNIPKRSKLGKQMRAMFIADYGHLCFGAGDQSQIEYRSLVHYAVGPGSDEVRYQYQTDPTTDYHKMTQSLVKEVGGVLLPRNGDEAAEMGMNLTIKEINFGLLYGMSEAKLARAAGLDKKKSSEVFKAYHAGAPYVKKTMEQAASEVQANGFITTILGRRTRFKMWEPVEKNYIDKQLPLPYDQAIRQYGSYIKRAYEYKAINYRLQGTAAEALKKAMLRCWKEGVYHVMGVPRLTVHDENGHSIADDSLAVREATAYMIHCMETSIPAFRIPLRFDWGTGANWGEC